MTEIRPGVYLRHLDDGRRIYVVGRSMLGGWLWREIREDGSWGRTRRGELAPEVWAVEGDAARTDAESGK